MAQFIKGVWLATVLFTGCIGCCWLLLRAEPRDAASIAAPAVIAAPPIWWWMIARNARMNLGRGAIAGAFIAISVWVLNLGIELVHIRFRQILGRHESEDGRFVFLAIFLAIVGLLVAIP